MNEVNHRINKSTNSNKNIHNAITEFNSKIYEIRRKKAETNRQNNSVGIILLKDQI